MTYIAACIAGVFAVDDGKILGFKLFPKDADVIAERLRMWDEGKAFAELAELQKRFPDADIRPADSWLNEHMRDLALEKGFVSNQAELNILIAKVGAARSKTKISVIERRDKLLVQAVSALGDMDKIVNAMSERLREWFGLHYSELNINDHEKYAKQVAEFGNRKNYPGFKTSMGMEITDRDESVFRLYAGRLAELYSLRKELEKYLEKSVPEEAPNTCALLGPVLTARLIAQAGSLEKLAKMPSSKIQLLGAEKALFRFLKDKGRDARPPKFGILYVHPDITNARRDLQGKVARVLASKLTIAVRADFYSKENRSAEILADYKARVKEVTG